MRRESKLKILGYSLAISLTGTPLVWAFNGIATDGSMGPAQVLSAPGVATNVNIPQSLGTTVGNNLFHSFSTFNIETGQTVTFKENITNSLANVISRVTGGSVSNLDGMLRSTPGGQADFYFINPAGIVFGANAQLDVAGAVHFSTADQLNFQDGGHYNATNPNASSLSSTAPSSFGFLGTSAANNGLIEFNGTQFSTKYGQTIESQKLDVVAEHIKIENSAKLKLPFGEIRLVAMQGQGQVDLQPTAYDHLPLPDSSLLNANGGDIVITDSSLLTTSLESGQGRVALWGGNVSIINSTLRADGYGNLDELPEQGIIIQSASLGVDSSIIHTESHGSGKAGALALTSTGNLNIVNGSTISTATSGGGDAGGLSIQAGSAILDGNANNTTRIGSDVLAGSIGNGGLVTVATPGSMELLNNAQISSTTTGQGDAGNISIQAESLKLDGSAGNGSPSIQSSAWSSGNAGSVKIIVGNGIEILADKVSQASNHDSILIPQDEGASISSYTLGSGNTGNVTVTANSMAINGFGNTSSRNGIFASTKKGSIGNAGVVSVEIVGDLNIFNSGFISSSTEGSGTSDGINVRAGNIHIDGTSDQNNTGILSASRDGTGNAGSVSVESINSISLFNGGLISTSSLGAGDAGNVRVKAESLVIDGSGFGLSTDNQVSVGIYATKVSPSLGRAGNISVETFGDLKLFNNGEISSSTYGSGLAGDIYVKAGNIEIDGKLSQNANISSDTYGEFGRAGTVKVESSGFISLSNGGFISSSSYSQGDAGNVSVKANSLIINGLGVQSFQESQANFTITGIFAAALPGSTGKAGSVSVDTVGNLKILDSGFISSSTWGLGAAGDVNVKAGNIQIEGRGGPNETGISSAALPLSGGQTGGVTVNSTGSINIANGGNISIENQGIAANPASTIPGLLYVSAPDITLLDSSITSQSTQNVNASPIQIHFTHLLSLGNSFISTEAQNGNGGSINIQGGDKLALTNSGIRTSVSGQNGNGGDISVTANRLTMETGLIQANTAAAGANGGNVFLNVQTLLPSASMLIIGGNEPVNWDIHSTEFGWNVIQAAAPGGISGVINLTSPQLNLNGVLSNLGNPAFYSDTLNQDVCSMGTRSSLVRGGRGGMPAKSSDPLLFY